MEIDDDWVNKIKLQKFQWHNQEWLDLMAQTTHGNNDQYEDVLNTNNRISDIKDDDSETDSHEGESRMYKSMVTSF